MSAGKRSIDPSNAADPGWKRRISTKPFVNARVPFGPDGPGGIIQYGEMRFGGDPTVPGSGRDAPSEQYMVAAQTSSENANAWASVVYAILNSEEIKRRQAEEFLFVHKVRTPIDAEMFGIERKVRVRSMPQLNECLSKETISFWRFMGADRDVQQLTAAQKRHLVERYFTAHIDEDQRQKRACPIALDCATSKFDWQQAPEASADARKLEECWAALCKHTRRHEPASAAVFAQQWTALGVFHEIVPAFSTISATATVIVHGVTRMTDVWGTADRTDTGLYVALRYVDLNDRIFDGAFMEADRKAIVKVATDMGFSTAWVPMLTGVSTATAHEPIPFWLRQPTGLQRHKAPTSDTSGKPAAENLTFALQAPAFTRVPYGEPDPLLTTTGSAVPIVKHRSLAGSSSEQHRDSMETDNISDDGGSGSGGADDEAGESVELEEPAERRDPDRLILPWALWRVGFVQSSNQEGSVTSVGLYLRDQRRGPTEAVQAPGPKVALNIREVHMPFPVFTSST